MKIELFPSRKEISEQEWKFEVGEMDLKDFLADFYQPGRLRLATLMTGRDYHITGELFLPMVLECSRCLESFRLSLQLPVFWLVRRVAALTPEDELPDGEFEILPETQELDFTARIRETIIFNLPAKPLCRPDCRGLCPTCGQNLNDRVCACRQGSTDPRWEGLKRLIE